MAALLETPTKVTPGELAAGTPFSVIALAFMVGTQICAVVFTGTPILMLNLLPVYVQAFEMGP